MTTQEKLLALLNRESGKDISALDASLEDFGFDSLEFVAMIHAVEDEFGCTIPTEKWSEINTPADLLKLI